MFRYLLLKLPSFTGKADFSVTPPCTKSSVIRPASPPKKDNRRELQRSVEVQKPHKRSYSFPCTRTRDSKVLDAESKCDRWDTSSLPKSRECQRREIHQSSKNSTRTTLSEQQAHLEQTNAFSTSETKRLKGEKLCAYKQVGKSKEFNHSIDGTERYELEAARPRRHHSEIAFNVLDHVTQNSNDPVRYLQPNRLRPFGSNDNICLPFLMGASPLENLPQPDATAEKTSKRASTPRSVQRKTDENQHRRYSTESKRRYCSEEFNTRNLENQKPIYVSKILSPKDDQSKQISENNRKKTSANTTLTANKTVEETLVGKTSRHSTEDVFHSYRISWNEPRISIEPSPFLAADSASADCERSETDVKPKPSTESVRLQAPWPSYSERVRRFEQKCPSESALAKENLQPKVLLPQKRNLSTENITRSDGRMETREIHSQLEKSTNDYSQKRSLSLENTNTRKTVEGETRYRNTAKRCRSTTAVSNTKSITPNLTSLSANDLNTSPKKTYARSSKSSNKSIPYEPESCAKKDRTKKYFLPSKVRLSPPECLEKPPYRGCAKEDRCPPRADQCLKIEPKKLPVLATSKCPCVEPYVPTEDPKMRRLKFKFEDPPKICPCDPCPCPPRADDSMTPEKKKLPMYVPGYCACVEPPPLVDVPLIKLKKVCEPEEVCRPPPKECPEKDPCERADDNLGECPKKLPEIKTSNCPCVEQYVPNVNPRLRRLRKIIYKDPPRECPCEPNCPCPPRADDLLVEKPKRLPIHKPGKCECIEPPPMIDVPLKRLQKVCTPEICDPQKYCPVETCEDKFRADDLLKETPKKLPVLKVSNCKCVEPEVPDKLPRLRRLRMRFTDEPRECPCEPNCPCPPRADDKLIPKLKRLLPYVPGNCKCVQPPPLFDIPLIPLKKICEPEEKCYPPEECPKEITCEEKSRADDSLCTPAKKLPVLEAKHCPCVENPKLVDVPKLKRLSLHVPEPEKVCPGPEPCLRSDDNLKEKIKKLPKLRPSPCLCIDTKPPEDVEPLKRLKCKEAERELVCEDPCVPFPRADWGCWEYLQSADPDNDKKCKKDKKRNTVNYDTKRKFNTDSRAVNMDGGRGYDNRRFTKISEQATQSSPLTKNVEPAGKIEEARIIRASKCSKKPNDLPKSNSAPTIRLLRQLNELEQRRNIGSNSPEVNEFRMMDIKSVLSKLSDRASIQNKALLSSNVRKLCTSANHQIEPVKRPVSTSNSLLIPNKGHAKDCNGKKKDKLKKGKCPTMTLKDCPPKAIRSCERERTPICCEKKSSPYPAFSEAMDEEVAPYSNTTQWTCNRKEYGFDPRPKKMYEPLDAIRNKKKFSTIASSQKKSQCKESYISGREKSRPTPSNSVRSLNTTMSTLTSFAEATRVRCQHKYVVGDLQQRPRTFPSIGRNENLQHPNDHKGEADIRFRRVPHAYKNIELLNRNMTQGIIGVNCEAIPKRGYSTLQQYTSTCSPLRTSNITQNTIELKSLSAACTHRNKTSARHEFLKELDINELNVTTKKRMGEKLSLKKEFSDNFQVDDCLSKQSGICNRSYSVTYEKQSSCIELNDQKEKGSVINRSSLAKERSLRLQPKHLDNISEFLAFNMVQKRQRKEDTTVEDDYTRKMLYADDLQHDFSEFGELIKPEKSKYLTSLPDRSNDDHKRTKDFRKDRNYPSRNEKNLCCISGSAFDMQKRHLSLVSNSYSMNNCVSDVVLKNSSISTREDLFSVKRPNSSNNVDVNKDNHKTIPIRTKRLYVRNYHMLYKNSEENVTADAEKGDKKAFLDLFRDMDETYKYIKLRNGQWRISNFQKWCKLNNLSNVPTNVKRFHICSSVKYKRYVRANTYKRFSTSTVNSMATNEDVYAQRNVSTTVKLAKPNSEQRIFAKPKLSVTSKCYKSTKKCPKFILSNCPPRARETCEKKPVSRPCTKQDTPSPAFSECYDEEILHPTSECPLERERMQRLQPKYPLLPEIGTASLPPPHQGRIDPSLENDYIRLKLGIKNEGLTQDCETFGQPVKSLRCRNYTKYMIKGKGDQCLTGRKKKDPCVVDPNPCKAPKQPCPSEPKPEEDNVWQKVVNYFKARPNCPAPDEWKKKALREKAEKAAKAAGMCLCEPKDLPKKLCNDNLPKVITPKDPCSVVSEDSDCDSCDDESSTTAKGSKYKKGNVSNSRGGNRCGPGGRRCISTVSKRCYSSNVRRKNIEEINKTIEESEKKRITGKVPRCFRDDRNLITNNCYDDVGADTGSYEDLFSEAVLNRSEESNISKYLEFDDKDRFLNYTFQIVPNDNNIIEIVVNEPSDEFSNYNQAKAFATVHDPISNFDAFPESSYEDAEKAKTNNLVKELDKLLQDITKKNTGK